MNDLDSVFATERARLYQIKDQDQFVFDTLTEIQAQRSNTLKWLLILFAAVMFSLVVLLQVFFFQAASFESISRLIKQLLVQNPHYFALFNLTVITAILAIRRFRLFW